MPQKTNTNKKNILIYLLINNTGKQTDQFKNCTLKYNWGKEKKAKYFCLYVKGVHTKISSLTFELRNYRSYTVLESSDQSH